jgi:hypothetical protein
VREFVAGVWAFCRRTSPIPARLSNPETLFDLSLVPLSLVHVLTPGLAQNDSGTSPLLTPEVVVDSSRPSTSSRDKIDTVVQAFDISVVARVSSTTSPPSPLTGTITIIDIRATVRRQRPETLHLRWAPFPLRPQPFDLDPTVRIRWLNRKGTVQSCPSDPL